MSQSFYGRKIVGTEWHAAPQPIGNLPPYEANNQLNLRQNHLRR